MSREVSSNLLFLQIPDLDQTIRGSGTEDQTVRVELATGKAVRDGLVSYLAQQLSWTIKYCEV